jgi:hypothetical protein
VFSAERVGVSPPLSLEDYVRLPHVLTSQRGDAHGVVDDALAKRGLTRTIALTTPRFLAVCRRRVNPGPSAFSVQRVSFAGGSDRDGITPLRGCDGATGQIRHDHTSCA